MPRNVTSLDPDFDPAELINDLKTYAVSFEKEFPRPDYTRVEISTPQQMAGMAADFINSVCSIARASDALVRVLYAMVGIAPTCERFPNGLAIRVDDIAVRIIGPDVIDSETKRLKVGALRRKVTRVKKEVHQIHQDTGILLFDFVDFQPCRIGDHVGRWPSRYRLLVVDYAWKIVMELPPNFKRNKENMKALTQELVSTLKVLAPRPPEPTIEIDSQFERQMRLFRSGLRKLKILTDAGLLDREMVRRRVQCETDEVLPQIIDSTGLIN